MSNLIDQYKKLLSPVTNGLSSLSNSAVNIAKTAVAPVVNFGQDMGRAAAAPMVVKTLNNSNQGLSNSLSQIQAKLAQKNLGAAERARYLKLQQSLTGQKQSNINVGSDIYNKTRSQIAADAIGTGATALGGAKVFTKQGAITAATSGAVGGVANKLFGGSFQKGVEEGIASTPQILGVSQFTNPLIEKYAAKLSGKIGGKAAKYIASSLARGSLNVPEGALISTAMGKGYDLPSAGFDIASGFIPGTRPGEISLNAAKHRTAMAAGDAQSVKDVVARMLNMKGNADYAVRFKNNDETFLRQMAHDYLDKNFAKSAPLQDIAQELMNRVRVDAGAQEFGLPQMGIAQKNISSEGAVVKGKVKVKDLPTETEIQNRVALNQGKPDLYTQREAKWTGGTDVKPSEPLPWEGANKQPETFVEHKKKGAEQIDQILADLEGKQRDKYKAYNDQGPAPETKQVISTANAQKNNKSKFNEAFNPLKNQTPDVQEATLNLDRAHKVAQVDANNVANSFKNKLDPKTEFKLVQYSQDPTAANAKALGLSEDVIKQNQDLLFKHQRFNDEIFARTNKSGIDTEYRQNHIYQQWKEKPEEIDNIIRAKGLGSKPGFANARQIDSFQKGMALGLTPKYTTFGQLNAAAEHTLGKTVANNAFADKMVKSGQLLPESQAPASWEYINARFFPTVSRELGAGSVSIERYKAPPELASFLNNYFGGQRMSFGDKALQTLAKLSGGAQNLALSGGIGPLNFFGIGQLVKEGTAGRVITPMKSFFRSFDRDASAAYEKVKNPLIKEMASQGISPRGIGNYQTIYKNVKDKKSIAKVLGDTWHTLIDEPTFGRLLNQLQIGFYEDTKNTLIKQGYSNADAIAHAAGATKKFYGISEAIGRPQGVQDALTTVFMAPQYRESMINIFKEIGKSFKPGNITNPESRGMQKLALGMAVTFAAYNAAQHNLTGKYMWDNPPGKEGELVIPVGDPKDGKYISIPWMPGLTAVPRRIAGTGAALVKGDAKEAASQAGGLLSIPVSKMIDLIRNKDYFGNEIARNGSQLTDIAGYAAGSIIPGYGRAAINYAQGKTTPAMAVAEGLELPIKKGTFPNPYFKAKNEATKGLTKDEKIQTDYLLQSDKAGGADSDTEAAIMLRNPKLIEVKRKIALASNPNDPLYTRPTKDILAFQAYRVANDTTQKAQLMLQNPWIPQVQFQLSQQMYNSQQQSMQPSPGFDPEGVQAKMGTLLNPAKPKTIVNPIDKPNPSPKQQLTPEGIQIVSAYTASPKGSLARKQLLAQNPWLKTYWDINDQYYKDNPISSSGPLADYLRTVGINPDTSLASGSSFTKKVKSVKIPKLKKFIVKIKKPKKTKSSYKLTKVKIKSRLKLT